VKSLTRPLAHALDAEVSILHISQKWETLGFPRRGGLIKEKIAASDEGISKRQLRQVRENFRKRVQWIATQASERLWLFTNLDLNLCSNRKAGAEHSEKTLSTTTKIWRKSHPE
jgi:hypothetical protein